MSTMPQGWKGQSKDDSLEAEESCVKITRGRKSLVSTIRRGAEELSVDNAPGAEVMHRQCLTPQGPGAW